MMWWINDVLGLFGVGGTFIWRGLDSCRRSVGLHDNHAGVGVTPPVARAFHLATAGITD